MDVLTIFGGAIAAIAIALFVAKVRNQLILKSLRQNLRVKLLHDEEKIERLIELEKKSNPSSSEIELYRAAIINWERFNR
jgi:hypothetical protein